VVDGEHRAFGDWLIHAAPTMEEWHEHLSTLFPEVRPRGQVELRSADALAPEWYAAPLALAAGIAYDRGALQAANELLGTPDPELLARGGKDGLRDAAMASVAADLFQLALAGCRRLGPAYFHPAHLDEAIAFFERFTRRGRAPADELVESAIAA
jgi:glutamate--cysteine ligase